MWIASEPEKYSHRRAWLKRARVLNENGNKESELFHYDEQIKIEIEYEIKDRVKEFSTYLIVTDSQGNKIWASLDIDGRDEACKFREPGTYHSTCLFPKRLHRPGRYYVTIGIEEKTSQGFEEGYADVISFEISDAGYAFNRDPRHGIITPYLNWEIVRQTKTTCRSIKDE